ncbi:hypothetical protein GCM10011401_06500 [Nesterenkonia cremea]|uniref:DhaL domain-containing protein n=2 Tax=Nesterenkonia cremea TaxID=1882340 RepID=A0A917AML3_9MICC|nr:hypothetical protein GCM10011401_06500 [Nesterenkonia cremea]
MMVEQQHKGRIRGHAAVHRWFFLAEQALRAHGDSLNRLNVFPVADSDTGANMLATMAAARQAAEQSEEDLGALLATAGTEAMAEARGNSGTLLAVLLSGFAEPLHGHERLTIGALDQALEHGSVRAWSALSDPVGGTMLSVLDAVRACARQQAAAAEEPESRTALIDSLDSMLEVARQAVVATEGELEALTRAGVVDSGGTGLLIIFDALRAAVTGTEPDPHLLEGLHGLEREPAAQPAGAEDEDHVEIMCTVRLDPLGAASLRHQLDEVGESVIITPIDAEADEQGSYRWRIHVHAGTEEEASQVIHASGEVTTYTAAPLYGAETEH